MGFFVCLFFYHNKVRCVEIRFVEYFHRLYIACRREKLLLNINLKYLCKDLFDLEQNRELKVNGTRSDGVRWPGCTSPCTASLIFNNVNYLHNK